MACAASNDELLWPPEIESSITWLLGDELFFRQESAMFLMDLGYSLNLSDSIIHSGIAYLQTFLKAHSCTPFNRFAVATICLIIAHDCLGEYGEFPYDFEIPSYWTYISKEMLTKTRLSSLYIDVHTKLLAEIISFRIEIPQMYIALYLKKFKSLVGISIITNLAFKLATVISIASPSSINFPPTIVATLSIWIAFSLQKIELESTFKETWIYMLNDLERNYLHKLIKTAFKEMSACQECWLRKIQQLLNSREFDFAPLCKALTLAKVYSESLRKARASAQDKDINPLKLQMSTELKKMFDFFCDEEYLETTKL